VSADNPYRSPSEAALSAAPPRASLDFTAHPLVVQYTGTFEDLVELNVLVHSAAGGDTRRYVRIVIYISLSLLIGFSYGPQVEALLASIGLGDISAGLAVAVVGAALVVADWLLAPILWRWLLQWSLPRSYGETELRRRMGPVRVTIDAATITEEIPHSLSRTDWCAVERIEARPEYCFLFLSQLRAHIVPRRAFDRDEEFEAFCEQAKAHLARVRM
jgi:hypothetical protein